jgi:hypothetical protein
VINEHDLATLTTMSGAIADHIHLMRALAAKLSNGRRLIVRVDVTLPLDLLLSELCRALVVLVRVVAIMIVTALLVVGRVEVDSRLSPPIFASASEVHESVLPS